MIARQSVTMAPSLRRASTPDRLLPPGRHQIFHQDDTLARDRAALDPFFGAVFLGFLADEDAGLLHRIAQRGAVRDARGFDAADHIECQIPITRQRHEFLDHLGPMFGPERKLPVVAIDWGQNTGLKPNWIVRAKAYGPNGNHGFSDYMTHVILFAVQFDNRLAPVSAYSGM